MHQGTLPLGPLGRCCMKFNDYVITPSGRRMHRILGSVMHVPFDFTCSSMGFLTRQSVNIYSSNNYAAMLISSGKNNRGEYAARRRELIPLRVYSRFSFKKGSDGIGPLPGNGSQIIEPVYGYFPHNGSSDVEQIQTLPALFARYSSDGNYDFAVHCGDLTLMVVLGRSPIRGDGSGPAIGGKHKLAFRELKEDYSSGVHLRNCWQSAEDNEEKKEFHLLILSPSGGFSYLGMNSSVWITNSG